ncbi:3-hydroxyacyl-CoA dehydrogenase family protein [Sporomusa sphaeroides]|uniref:3-hydroxybutyryl-CoA dehydrogenase n=2 Tax=Sporomusa TaxID=2375 RepID=A0ABM9W8B3_9FIRM|nr:3-hydroxyacyl-CoA dehydrogenase NAD-binding domain-containing protein [Sporomusa sphaeroides]OLS56020.1 putative 3-hydroxybutyryl-CoA dehydrogenase [Sporomusa sphaeroides DSM 2875]CVK20231.1 putative 3-hydroxybutyryl-CoA dehydrogenase [Sporomusa sphaeroides DSM 2875]SCM82737.1 3-hydroxyacyl-CoA dehydrogenase [uncultured Sporomusa sp.]
MIQNIGVIGAGTMGHGIALSFAMYGYNVNLYDAYENQLKKALTDIADELALLVEEHFIEPEAVQATLARIKTYGDLRQAVQDRDFVIEAAPENLELKQNLFKQLDEFCPKHTILASNTSSLPLDGMMALVPPERRQRMLVNHWYNPAHLMPIVELSCFGNMPEDIYNEVEAMFATAKKQTVKVLKDVPGLVANRIQQGVAREVFSLIEMGVAEPADIDKALKFGPAFRYATTGQLEVADFGGLDIWCIVGNNLLKEMDNRKEANDLLKQKVAEGKLGLKSGEGFYKYNPDEIPGIKKEFMKKLIHQLKASEYYTQK